MEIQGLLHKQKIVIDHHQRGSGTPNDWDDSSKEVHIDKFIKHGKDSFKIKVPINSNNPITIDRKDGQDVPEWLKREICETFKDDKIRSSFVDGICKATSAYNSKHLTSEQRAKQAIGYVRKAFGLPTPRYVFKNEIKNFFAGLYMLNSHYYYVLLKDGYMYCSLNEGIWKRFSIGEESATYRYDREIKSITYTEY